MKVMVIGAHADDEVLGCGGVIARHVAAGDEVYVTLASRGDPQVFPPEEMAQLEEEKHAAHALLEISETVILPFFSPRLLQVPQDLLADAVREVLDRIRPQVVYVHHRFDCHRDHGAVFDAVWVATRPVGDCSVERLLCYETLSETDWSPPFGQCAFVPTYFVDISAVLEKKLEALRCYASQLRDPRHPRTVEAIDRLARLRGASAGLLAAEAFVLVREIVK